ncbi:MAG: hypothetical protein V1929_06165 [bacterium]
MRLSLSVQSYCQIVVWYSRWFRRCSSAMSLMLLALFFAFSVAGSRAEEFVILTPTGPILVDIPHVGPSGSLVEAASPESPAFRPPSIFSAPLPSGSGARALGLAGAFTAVADDATAASWNPAGLIQLETPEASFMLRASRETQKHHSGSESLTVGDDEFENYTLNYLSGVYPFHVGERNFVFSLNYQEAYDFNQKFTADFTDTASRSAGSTTSDTYHETLTDHYEDEYSEVDLTSEVTTKLVSSVDQIIGSDLLTALDFDQQGIIEAFTPSMAVEISPKLFLGASFNYYQDSALDPIRSSTRAKYSGRTDSSAGITDVRTTSGTYTYTGVFKPPLGGPDVPFGPDYGIYRPFSDTTESGMADGVEVDGEYEEINEFDDLEGYNGTFGFLWTVSRYLSLGGSVDLPWVAKASQEKTVRNTVTTFNDTRTEVLDVTSTEDVQGKGVEFEFPLYWALGSVIRLNDRLYTSFDVSKTYWSDFSFQAEGEEKINPLDGTPYGENKVDDCWSVRGGIEYLLVLTRTEIPFRGGVAWEQRPAVGAPDEYWSYSLGSGVSIGKGDRKLIIDIAYVLTCADDVLGSLVPQQGDLTSDVVEHQVFLSCIRHF